MPTVLLCHCDGTSGSTTFTDVSPSAHALTVSNGAVVSTSQVKFGTGAANFIANSSAQIFITDKLSDFDFQSGPFTIEAWAYAVSAPNIGSIFSQFNNTPGNGWFFGSIFGNLAFWYYDGSGTQQQFASSTAITTGAWHFYTADRDAGGTLRLYIDGAVVASTSAPTFQSAATQTNIGNSTRDVDGWPGYIDEVRVTKGTALYAGAFTPPTGPFPSGALVNLAGNLGVASQYGNLPYGLKLYSQAPFAPVLSATINNLATFSSGNLAPAIAFAGALSELEVFSGNLAPVVGLSAGLTITPATQLAGNFAPAVSFSATLTIPTNIVGDLAPAVALAANLSVTYAVAGDLAPQTALGASLAGDWLLAGNMAPNVGFAASVEAGPLWAASQPCPLPGWDEETLCPPAMWTPVPPPQWQIAGSPGGYGLAAYGTGPYNLQSADPWYETELCNGG
jgi:hypothetical protein